MDSKNKEPHTEITATWLDKKIGASAGLGTSITLIVLIFGYLVFLSDLGSASQWMAASNHSVFAQHYYWQAWTTLFVHADQKHFLSNAFLFVILGYFIIGYFGFVLFPLLAFFFGGITNLIVLKTMSSDVHLIGASGVVYWMGAVWLVLYFLIDKRRSVLQRSLRTLGTALVLFMPAEAFDPNISYQTHFVGFCGGVIVGLFYYFLKQQQFDSSLEIRVIEESEI